MLRHKLKQTGFTLLEMMLVMAIISALVTMAVNISQQRLAQFQRDRTAVQIQQILNAGLSYYTSNGKWPVVAACNGTSLEMLTSTQTLQSSNFLPSTASIQSPWQTPYYVGCNTTNGLNYFTVTVDTTTDGNAAVLSGELPIATVLGSIVTSNVTVPGQNLNNARSVNFANVYHPGACIPAPVCPNGMIAEVFVMPASVSGINDSDMTYTGSPVAYPITSFTAYVSQATPAASPLMCDVWQDNLQTTAYANTASSCLQTQNPNPTNLPTAPNNYWRVCLDIQTVKGKTSVANNSVWAQYVSVVAMTRCSPQNENTGSDFTVWSN